MLLPDFVSWLGDKLTRLLNVPKLERKLFKNLFKIGN